jgi:hypothetical protein
MFKSIEIRRAKNGFVVSAQPGRVLRFSSDACSDDVRRALDAAADGVLAAVPGSNCEAIDFPPVEHIAKNADEALAIARDLLERQPEKAAPKPTGKPCAAENCGNGALEARIVDPAGIYCGACRPEGG